MQAGELYIEKARRPGVAKSSAGVVYSEGGAASSGKILKSGAPERGEHNGEVRLRGRPGAIRSDRRGRGGLARCGPT